MDADAGYVIALAHAARGRRVFPFKLIPKANGARDASYGLGYGLRASPAGVYVIKVGEVEWKPALDINRASLQRAGVAIVALCVLRSIIRTLATR